jgi:hypothetical protein
LGLSSLLIGLIAFASFLSGFGQSTTVRDLFLNAEVNVHVQHLNAILSHVRLEEIHALLE